MNEQFGIRIASIWYVLIAYELRRTELYWISKELHLNLLGNSVSLPTLRTPLSISLPSIWPELKYLINIYGKKIIARAIKLFGRPTHSAPHTHTHTYAPTVCVYNCIHTTIHTQTPTHTHTRILAVVVVWMGSIALCGQPTECVCVYVIAGVCVAMYVGILCMCICAVFARPSFACSST